MCEPLNNLASPLDARRGAELAQFTLNRLANASMSSSVDGDGAVVFPWFVLSIEPSNALNLAPLAGAQQSFFLCKEE